uniref:solute carrier family 2, facilitated glucose transporter member 8-like n=1 Tax=Ciona intestinalis TaxID=7719 RepID=UPI0002B8D4BF|nr:solute carrier family 2, facilitated glucose transporter member 8-like [Ciona intestinalis]|eukprot:XP_002128611.2 solute carrier family 2, facilitated glucose transporter member 8-like [Ciona intestinalis]
MEDSNENIESTRLLKDRNYDDGSKIPVFIYSGIMILGAVSTGTVLGLSAPMIPLMQKDNSSNAIHVGTSEASWIGSLLMLGGMVGGGFAGLFMQHFGRKATAIVSGVPYIGGLLLISFATNIWMVYAGRVITGIAMAFTSLVVPTYVSEISTKGLRGLLGSGNQLGITFGVFLAYAAGQLPWRMLPLFLGCVPVVFVFACLFIPEAPQYLILDNKPIEAAISLQKVRGKNTNIQRELEGIRDSLNANAQSASWVEIFTTPSIRWPLFLSVLAMFLQQFSGINCVMFYFHTIFETAGFKTATQLYMASLLVSGIQVVFTAVSCLLIDRTGRRVLLGFSGGVMALSMVAFGLYFQLTYAGHKGNLNWLALSSMMVYIVAFSLGLGPIPWVLMAELIPLRGRAKCGGLVTTFNLFFAFITTKEFQDLVKATSSQATFWMFGGVCATIILYAVFLLPETKGRTLEEIEQHFQRHEIYESLDGATKQDIAPAT